jgi:protein ImuB
MDWLAIHLPDLSLEVHTRGAETPGPVAVSRRARREEILGCNGPAAALGVRPGMPLGGALALAADLRVLSRDEAAERAALERLAAWCQRFTPTVSLAPPQALVLEVAQSLRLFGGAEAILDQAGAGVAGLGYRALCCLAPTPGGALVLAASGGRGIVADATALRQTLARLPLAALGTALDLTPQVRADLRRMGLARVADLLRLPRAGLAERLGEGRITTLARILGERPDPRRRFDPPPRYRGRIELLEEVEHAGALIFPCRRLIEELCGLLIGRQRGAQRLDWRLGHARAPETRFSLGTARPERDPNRWLTLLRGRLERLALPGPVRAVALAVNGLEALPPEGLALFPELEVAAAPDPGLLDRLRSRLGEGAVRGLAPAADHRPERAWHWCAPGHPAAVPGRKRRPLWLLPEPLPLERCHRPEPGEVDDVGGPPAGFAGPAVRPIRFRMERGPFPGGCIEVVDLGEERERIETGWWDDQEVARDYFVATTVRGERLWIYRECRGRRGWYLHGLFG